MAALVGISFAAGLNVYATLATLGLLSRFGVFPLPPSLHIIASWYVIGISLLLFLVEMFADKVPLLDLVWNALHTFIRVPLAALVAYQATTTLSPWGQIIVSIASAGIALAAHGGKMAVRAAVTPSPEPVSNAALSVGEDVLAVSLTWIATKHPFIAAVLALLLVVVVVLFIRWVISSLGALFRGAEREWSHRTRPGGEHH